MNELLDALEKEEGGVVDTPATPTPDVSNYLLDVVDMGDASDLFVPVQPPEPEKQYDPLGEQVVQPDILDAARRRQGEGVLGMAEDVVVGTASGVLRGGEMVFDAAEWFIPSYFEGLEGGAASLSDKMKAVREENPYLFAESIASEEARQESIWNPRGWLHGGFESLGMLAPGVVTGPWGIGVQFYGATAQEAWDEAESNERQGIGEKLSFGEKMVYANLRGFFEGGVEMIQSRIPFKLNKFLPKGVQGNLIRAAIKQPGNPIMNATKGILKTIAAEVPMEMFQEAAGMGTAFAFGQSELDPMSEEGRHQIAAVIGPTIIMSAVLGFAGNRVEASQRKALHDALTKPDVDPAVRLQAVKAVHDIVAKEDQELATMWLEQTQANLDAGQPVAMPLDEEVRAQAAEGVAAGEELLAQAVPADPLTQRKDELEIEVAEKKAQVEAKVMGAAEVAVPEVAAGEPDAEGVIAPAVEDAPASIAALDRQITLMEGLVQSRPDTPQMQKVKDRLVEVKAQRRSLIAGEAARAEADKASVQGPSKVAVKEAPQVEQITPEVEAVAESGYVAPEVTDKASVVSEAPPVERTTPRQKIAVELSETDLELLPYGSELSSEKTGEPIRDAEGNITGRTPSMNPSWYQDNQYKNAVSVKNAAVLLEKARNGESLTETQELFVREVIRLNTEFWQASGMLPETAEAAQPAPEAQVPREAPKVAPEAAAEAQPVPEAKEHVAIAALRERLAEPIEQVNEETGETKAVKKLAKKFGKKIVFYKGSDKTNGFFRRENADTLFVNLDGNPILFTFGHELLHALRSDDTALYRELAKAILNTADAKGFSKYFKSLNEALQNNEGMGKLTPEQVAEELLADFSGEQFLDPQFWQDMLAADETLFNKVVELFEKLFEAFKNFSTGPASKHFKDIQKAQAAMREALKTYAVTQKEAAQVKAEPAPVKKVEPKFSVKDPTFKVANVTEAKLPPFVKGQLPSKAEGGKYYSANKEALQNFLDRHGDGFLYRVTSAKRIKDGHDIGKMDYLHQFKDQGAKTFAFTSSMEDARTLLDTLPSTGYIVYRIQPQDLADNFAVQVHDGNKNLIFAHSPLPASTSLADVVYRNGEWLEGEATDDTRRTAEERRTGQREPGVGRPGLRGDVGRKGVIPEIAQHLRQLAEGMSDDAKTAILEGLDEADADRRTRDESETGQDRAQKGAEEGFGFVEWSKRKGVSRTLAINMLNAYVDRSPRVFKVEGEGYTAQQLQDMFTADLAKAVAPSGTWAKFSSGKLSVLHNLTNENLAFADQMGGLAVPSLAVVPEDTPLTGFGDISLIGRSNLGDPKEVPILDADAYTATFPSPSFPKPKEADVNALMEEFKAMVSPYEDRPRWASSNDIIWDNTRNTKDPHPGRVVSELIRLSGVKAAYLQEQGAPAQRRIMKDAPLFTEISKEPSVREWFKEVYEPWVAKSKERVEAGRKRDEELRVEHGSPWNWPQELQDSNYKKRETEQGEYEDEQEQKQKQLASVVDAAVKNYDFGKGEEAGEALRPLLRNSLFIEKDSDVLSYYAWDKMTNDYKMVGKRVLDTYAISNSLDKKLKGKEEGFSTWVAEKVNPIFSSPRIKVDGRLQPYTIDNIVKVMTKGDLAAKEETMVYGEGKARAAATRQFTNLEDMRATAGEKIRDENELNEARDKAKEMLSSWRENVSKYYKYDSTWDALDDSMKAIAAWANAPVRDGRAMKRALSRMDFVRVPAYVVEEGVEAGTALLDAPVPYFEAKPQRAVSLDEFAGAAIPKDASQDTKDILDRHGIQWVAYGARFDEDARTKAVAKLRKKLLKQGEDVLFSTLPFQQDTDPLGYYSELSKAVDAIGAKAMPSAHWLARLRKTQGVKADELKWTGVEEWLGAQEGKVTKEALQEFLRANGVQVEEVTLDQIGETDSVFNVEQQPNGEWAVIDADDYTHGTYATEAEAEEAKRQFDEDEGVIVKDATKYGDYTLPGGENYREVLLTLPTPEQEDSQHIKNLRADLLKLEAERDAIQSQVEGDFPSQDQATKISAIGGRIRRTKGNLERALDSAQTKAGEFKSQHFDQPNILAHIRLNDRVGPNGEKILFIEELQSDWAQEGRKRGFAAEPDIRKDDNGFYRAYDQNGELIILWVDRESFQALATKEAVLQALPSSFGVKGVPKAPFVESTKKWLDLALKRVLRIAAEGGYDAVSWTPGEVQADRYDLSKQVEEIKQTPIEGNADTIDVILSDGGNGPSFDVEHGTGKIVDASDQSLVGKTIDDVLGKELGKKIMSFEGQRNAYQGEDLKVGGEGMKSFYDSIVPKAMGKLVKKLDQGAKVGVGGVITNPQYTSEELAAEGMNIDTFVENDEGVKTLTLPITDVMREGVMTGQPLFSVQSPEFKKWFGDSKVVDDNGEPLKVYHGTKATVDDEFAFDYSRIGEQGRTEGAGFYFTNNLDIARGYTETAGEVIEGYMSIQNPISFRQPGFDEDTLRKLLTRVGEIEAERYGEEIEDGFLANFGDIRYEGMDSVLDSAVEAVAFDDNALNQISGLVGAGVDINIVNTATKEVTGHDGVMARGFSDEGDDSTKVVVAFFPEQIKSQKNVGTYNPNDPRIKFSAKTPQQVIEEKFQNQDDAKATLTGRINNAIQMVFDSDRRDDLRQTFDKARTLLVDKYAPINRELGEEVYKLHRMLNNAGATIGAFLQHGPLSWNGSALSIKTKNEGFVPWFHSLGEEGHKFMYWVAAKRAEKLAEEDRENWLTEEDRKALTSDADARGMTKKYEEWNKKLQEFNNNVIDVAVEAGLIDPAARRKWMSHYYLPFYRLLENEETADEFLKGPMSSKKYITSGVKELKGGEAMLGDPLQNLMQNWTHLISESQRQMARSSAGELMVGMGTAQEMSKGQLVKILGVDSTYGVRGQTADQKVNWSDFADMSKAEVNAFIAKENKKPGVNLSLIEKQVIRQSSKEEAKVMSFMRDGKPVYLKVDDAELFQALTQINSKNLDNGLITGASWFKRILTYGATFGVGFRIANLLRDTLHTAVVSKSFIPFVDTAKGIVKVWAKNPDYIELMASGGGFSQGYLNSADPKALTRSMNKIMKTEGIGAKKRVLSSPRKLLDFWERIGHASEMAARVQLYTNLKAEGKTHMDAAYEARDILDFALSGQGEMIKVLTATIPFLNARMQGLDRLARGARDNPVAFMTKGAIVASASLALWAMYRDDDRYKQLEDFDKWTYHHFWIGDEHFRVPKAFEVGAIFSTMFEATAETMVGDEDFGYFTDMLAHTFTSTFAVGTPAVVTPLAEIWANKSFFTGRQIEPEWMQKLEPGARANPWTSESLKQIGKATGISPVKLQTLVRGYTATIGTGLLTIADMALEFQPDVVTPAKRAHEVVGLDRFMRSRPGGSKYATRYHEWAQEVMQLANTISHYKNSGDMKTAKKMAEASKDYKARTKMAATVNKKLAAVRKQEKMVWSDLNMSRELKRKKLDDLKVKKNEIYKQAYRQIRNQAK